MSQIQKRLNDLQPYVAGIRFVTGLPVIDVVFKEGWTVPESKIVQKERSEQDPNYYMFYTQNENIGFDELLDYVEEIIKINIEREVKHELLKIKVKELQILFKENTLEKLNTLKFVLGKENLVPDIMSDDFNVDIDIVTAPEKPEVVTPKIEPEVVIDQHQHNHSSPPTRVKPKRSGMADIELPPKGGKIEVEEYSLPPSLTEGECSCGPDEYCPKCMDNKGY